MYDCDIKIAELLNNYIDQKPDPIDDLPSKKAHKRLNKNSVKTIDLNIVSYQYFDGVDLLDISGVSYSTVLSLMSELGPQGINKFPTAKHFTSWLPLATNNKISGGKIMSSKVPRGSNRLKIAFKKSGTKAITATARKLAVIVWHMLTKKIPYQAQDEYLFLDQKRKQIAEMRRKITKFEIDPNELGLFSRPGYAQKYATRCADNQGLT